MTHHKRKKSRRVVRCTLCTPHRWLGNRSIIIQSQQLRAQVETIARELLGDVV